MIYPRIFSLKLWKHSMYLTVISSILLYHNFSNTWHFCYCEFSSLLFLTWQNQLSTKNGVSKIYSKMIYDWVKNCILLNLKLLWNMSMGDREMYFCKFYHLPFRKKEWAMVYDIYHRVQVIVKFYYPTISIVQRWLVDTK